MASDPVLSIAFFDVGTCATASAEISVTTPRTGRVHAGVFICGNRDGLYIASGFWTTLG